MSLLLVTGGYGFLGANFIRYWRRRHPRAHLVNIDYLTYAGGRDNLGELIHSPRYTEQRIDIANLGKLHAVWPKRRTTVVHFAAETHVDRSLIDAQPFSRTNIQGTLSLLEIARTMPIDRLIIISTDEVYGPTPPRQKYREGQPLRPTNPYAASKASADLLALAYRSSYDLPIVILRSVNVYGPRQYPEKFIPLAVTNALAGSPVPVYGDGEHQRDWLWVDDFCAAVYHLVSTTSIKHPVYHIAAHNHRRNYQVAEQIIRLSGGEPEQLQYVADRPGHDRRYALDDRRFREEFDWEPKKRWRNGLKETVQWYRENTRWIARRRKKKFHDYYRRTYQWRLNE